ncbi:hypothetical protein [Streptomyces sp. NPDC059015]|uniref:hypothetical protein n=1 Tax=unclassified Streptomyces TaxID=2593676 RepID=UPI0036C6691C
MAALAHHTSSHLQLLGSLVTQRRVALGFSSKEKAADACGLSHMTYRHVEGGRPVSDTTYAKIENRFEFVAGSCKTVAEGNADSIRLLDGTELIHGGQITRPSFKEVADEVKQAITDAARLTAPDLTLGQTEEMTERVVKELQRRGILPSGS